VQTWEGYESYLPKLDYVIENIGNIGVQSYTANKKGCGLNVFNHGDLHLRNILVKANQEQHIESFYLVSISCLTATTQYCAHVTL
jgi:Ecdysteroid kinase-like family